MSRKSNTEEFIFKSKRIHGERYDYSLVKYVGAATNVEIICSEHGRFIQKPNKHLSGQGCPLCSKNKILSQDEFISQCTELHDGFYDYSKVYYKSRESKVVIICPIHGEFTQLARNHLSKKSGCKACSKKIKHTTDSFITKARSIHGTRYDYSLVDYQKKSVHVKIICPVHGIFEQTPNNHFNSKIGCNQCKLDSTESRASRDITKMLEPYVVFKEFRFDDCKNHYPLPFDFYVPEFNLLIEYDGIHHFKPIEFWGGDEGFCRCVTNDAIKNNYCKDKNINLLRIKYTEEPIETLKRYFYETFGVNLKD